MLCGRDARREAIEWDYVGTLGEDGFAIDEEEEAAADVVFLAAQLDGTQANADRGACAQRRPG